MLRGLVAIFIFGTAASIPHHRFRGGCGDATDEAGCVAAGCGPLPKFNGKFAGCKDAKTLKEVSAFSNDLTPALFGDLCAKKGGVLSASGKKCETPPDFTKEAGCSAGGGRWSNGMCFAGNVKKIGELKCKTADNGCTHFGQLFYGKGKSEDGKTVVNKEDKQVCIVGCADMSFTQCDCWGIPPDTFKKPDGTFLTGKAPADFPFKNHLKDKMKFYKKDAPLSV